MECPQIMNNDRHDLITSHRPVVERGISSRSFPGIRDGEGQPEKRMFMMPYG